MTNLLKKQNQIFNDKESMLAMVSHDMKNPVNAGIMAIRLLEDAKLSPLNSYQKELIENIFGSLRYMKDLIENILDRYKLTNNVYKLNKISVDFAGFVSSVIEQTKYICAEKSQTIKLFVDLKNSTVELDLLEIKRVINNLISNSSIYSPDNSEIIIRLFEKGNDICFSIENVGKGIKNPYEVFEKFYTNNSNNLKSFATGLGLYIVKEIITAHNGQIFIESEINKLTRVTFTLPRK